jgi:hypothetical protein
MSRVDREREVGPIFRRTRIRACVTQICSRKEAPMSRAAKHAALAAFTLFIALGQAGCVPRPEKKPAAGADLRAEVQALFDTYVEALN